MTFEKIRIIESDLKETFLTYVQSIYDSYATMQTYRYPMDRFLRFLNEKNIERVQDVTEETIDDYRKSLIKDNFKSTSMEVYLRTVRLFFRYLEDEGTVFFNPTCNMVIPKADRKMQYVPTIKEMERFLDIDVTTAPRLRNKALFETAYSCAGRMNEIRMIDVKDVNIKKEEVRLFGKGQKERIVPIGATAVHWLERYLKEARPQLAKDKDEQALFLARRGNRITKMGLQKQVEYHQKQSNTKITMHAIRRACVTHMLRNGASPMVLQKMLGHSDVKHLSQYLNVTITDLKKMHEQSTVSK